MSTSRLSRVAALATCVLGVAGLAVGQTCDCCRSLWSWGDGSSEGNGEPCVPGEVQTCEYGTTHYTLPSSVPQGKCSLGPRPKVCMTYSPATSLNIVVASCGLPPAGFRVIGTGLGYGEPEQCCYIDDDTYAAGVESTLPGAGIINCAGAGCP